MKFIHDLFWLCVALAMKPVEMIMVCAHCEVTKHRFSVRVFNFRFRIACKHCDLTLIDEIGECDA